MKTVLQEVRGASSRAKAGIVVSLALLGVEVLGVAVWWACDNTFVGELALRTVSHLA